jgi:hypothetical protein
VPNLGLFSHAPSIIEGERQAASGPALTPYWGKTLISGPLQRVMLATVAPPNLSRRRRLLALAAAAVCSVVLVGLLGHATREAADPGHEHAVHGVLGLCFVMVALLGSLAVVGTPSQPRTVRHDITVRRIEAAPRRLPAGHARASPAWLQRFLH